MDVQQRYFAGFMAFQEAVRRRDYALAAQAQKLTLPIMEAAIREIPFLYRDARASLPLIERVGIAVAALNPDAEVEEMFERLSKSPLLGSRVESGAVARARSLVERIAEVVATNPGLSRQRLREIVKPVDAREFSRLLDYMAKGAYIHESGATYTLHRTSVPKQPTTPFRHGKEPFSGPVIDLSALPRALGKDIYDRAAERNDETRPGDEIAATTPMLAGDAVRSEFGAYRIERVPKALKLAGTARGAVLRGATWLFTFKRPASAPHANFTATILDHQGRVIRLLELPHTAERWSAQPDRTWISIFDSDLTIHVYREDGEPLLSIPLAGNPDIEAELARAGYPGLGEERDVKYQFRSFDFDPVRGQVVFTLFDVAWCATIEGNMLWSLRAPCKAYPSGAWQASAVPRAVASAAGRLGLRRDLSSREAAAYLHARGLVHLDYSSLWSYPLRAESSTGNLAIEAGGSSRDRQTLRSHMGELTIDRIEKAQFTDSGVSLSTGYGLNVEVGDDGGIRQLWNSAGTLNTLISAGGGRIGTIGRLLVSVAETVIVVGTSAEHRSGPDMHSSGDLSHILGELDGTAIAGPDWVAGRTGSTITIASAPGWSPVVYSLPIKSTAFYPVGDHLRIHMGTFWAIVPIRPTRVPFD